MIKDSCVPHTFVPPSGASPYEAYGPAPTYDAYNAQHGVQPQPQYGYEQQA